MVKKRNEKNNVHYLCINFPDIKMITLKEVGNDTRLQKEFLQLPISLYKNEPCWIRPIDTDIEDVFNSQKNKYFKNGVCIRWVAFNEKNQVVGRVAAFIDHNTAKKDNDQPTGGMGFFECIDNQEIAFLLFDKCKDWLQTQGIEAMDGPINFGERDQWWGLLVDGFDKEPTYKMNYHFPYYRDFFENYGFKTYFKQYTFQLATTEKEVRSTMDKAVLDRADRIYAIPEYSFKHIEKKNLDKFADDFRIIYNKAWVKHSGLGEMSQDKAIAIMKRMKPILDEQLMWFGYYNEEPVAFFIMLPELNQIFKYVNGKLDLIGKIKFLWHKILKTNKKAMGIIFGIVPEHQKKGVESAIVLSFTKIAWQKGFQYSEIELNWIGDFNPKMLNFAKMAGSGKPHKTFITYRYLFDRNKEFKRCPEMK